MKKSLIAALTSATLATPAFADDQDSVFDCFTETLDEHVEMLRPLADGLAGIVAHETGLPATGTLEAVYSQTAKQDFISACEATTGQTATGLSTGLTEYSNGNGVKIIFEPDTP